MRNMNLVVTAGLMLLGSLSGCGGSGGETVTINSFSNQYCALVAPCCSQAGLVSGCAALVTYAAQEETYDATAGAACLAALTALRGGADFCGGLVAISNGAKPSWAVVPACAAVFRGTTPAGQFCAGDSDCAPGPNGGAICLMEVGMHMCVPLTGKVGDACFGTYAYGETLSYPGHTGAICDQNQGAVCDEQTFVCDAVEPVGSPCTVFNMCDPVTAYCTLSGGNSCAARLPLGAICTGTLSGECDGNAYCSAGRRCTAPGGAGAACTGNTTPLDCLSGVCSNGSCANPLFPVCQ